MPPHRGVETDFELTTIERLEGLGYEHLVGTEIERSPWEVVFPQRLEAFLRRRYPDLPAASLELALGRFSRPTGVDLVHRNLDFHLDG